MNPRTIIRLIGLVTVVLSLIPVRSSADDVPLQQLIDDLKNGSAEEATRAAYSLAKMGPNAAPAISVLIDTFSDTRPQSNFPAPVMPSVGHAAADALTAIGEPAVPTLLELLNGEDQKLRAMSLSALRKMKTVASPAEPALRKIARNPDDELRGSAISGVTEVSTRPPEETVAFLRPFLVDEELAIRRQAVGCAADYGEAARVAVPELISALDDDSRVWTGFADVAWEQPFRIEVVSALRQLGPVAVDALPRLRQVMRGDEVECVRIEAAFAVARIDTQDAESVDLLIKTLDSNGQSCGYAESPPYVALAHLAEIPDRAQAAVGKVRTLTGDSDRWTRSQALKTLRALTGAEALPILTKALSDEEEYVRVTAAQELGKLGPSAATAVNDLILLVQSDEDWLGGRKAAVEALMKIGRSKEVIVPALCDALRTPNYLGDDLFTIVDALKQFGASDLAVETLKALIESTDNDDRRERATQALKGLEGDTNS